jgi:hypothetical protein
MKRLLSASAVGFLAFLLATTCARSDSTIQGHNVTVTGQRPLQAYLRESPGPGGTIHFDMWEVSNGKVVQTYDTDMTKIMHMIVVSDDLLHFDHIHPVLQSNGHLTIDYRPAERGLYHVYIDGMPHGVGRQVFRFDVPSGGSNAPAAARILHAAGSSVQVGPYRVTLDPVLVPIGEISTVDVTITKNGKPARDLHPYLGTMAHGVFVGVKDLAYMHAHGMSEEMLAMASANDCGDGMMAAMMPLVPSDTIDSHFEFEILAPSAQDYDFWLQFVGGTTLYTAPFLVTGR